MKTCQKIAFGISPLLCCISSIVQADKPTDASGKGRRQLGLPPRLQLDHVIHAIDQLYLVDADFFFDGGSQFFSFGESKRGEAIVHVCLPRPGTVMDRSQTIHRGGKQLVLASPHSGFGRYAVATKADPSYPAFVQLIRDAKIGKSDQLAGCPGIETVFPVLKDAVIKGTIPTSWGADAFPWYGSAKESGADSDEEADDPFRDL